MRFLGKQSKPRVYVTRALPGDAIERLQRECDVRVWDEDAPPSRETLLEETRNAEGLLCLLTDNVDAGLLEAAVHLRVISTMAVGYDHIDIDAATARGVLVTHTPGVLTETTADFAFALLLAAARRLPEGDRAVREGRWTAWQPTFLVGQDVYGATLGIVGLGAIGAAVAKRARGFAMRVLYCGPARNEPLEEELGLEYTNFEGLLARADFVSVHARLTPETRHLFNEDAFRRMKPTAVFVNTARGAIVDEGALLRALENRVIAAAAIDVTETEPLAKTDMLLRLPNLLVTPHIASASVATRTRMAGLAVDNVLDALAGRRPGHPVNPQVLNVK
ncbi:MAG: D-glycerate dehydrogenase [Dehalococcoidia bacterium]